MDYCWSAGLPVLHISVFPPGAKKMEGLASVRSSHYAVVLSKNVKHSAWLLFILTHDLGHIVQGHVSMDGVLVDELVDRSSRDKEEKAANAFALELLTGTADLRVLPMGPRRSARALARAALDVGVHEQIDPGHIVLHCAYQVGGDFFALANAALRLLEPHADAIGIVQSRMIAHLDKTKLPKDTYDFILLSMHACADSPGKPSRPSTQITGADRSRAPGLHTAPFPWISTGSRPPRSHCILPNYAPGLPLCVAFEQGLSFVVSVYNNLRGCSLERQPVLCFRE